MFLGFGYSRRFSIALLCIAAMSAQSAIAQSTSQPGSSPAKTGQESMAELGSNAASAAYTGTGKPLWQPYYIFPRSGDQHLSLQGKWQMAHLDTPIAATTSLDGISDWIAVLNNSSVHTTLFQAGRLPDPYAKSNAEQYRWVEQKVWYYKKDFVIGKEANNKYVFLSFDGIDYFARIWLNDTLLGRHEGMFGGPAVEVSRLIKPGASNKLVVEVISANYRMKKPFNPKAPGKVIKGWAFTGGTGVENFFTVGLWQGARIDLVSPVHFDRPFVVTKLATPSKAILEISAEVFARKHSLEFQMHPWGNAILSRGVVSTKLNPVKEKLSMLVKLTGNDGKSISKRFPVHAFEGRNWIKHEIEIPHPQLWWPNGMGKPNLYKVQMTLADGDVVLDQIELDYGIRTIQTLPNAGPQVEERWKNWHFTINGKSIFLKGINWMPADVLLNLPESRYRWLLQMMKASGIQLVRVWGSGLMETEKFYKLCNEYGLMVWQDFPLSHYDAPDYPADVWEAQILNNVFRLRNHPSLAVYNGGNGLNPYSHGNNRTLGILERVLNDFDPSRIYSRTTSDAGNAHLYPDIDPSYFSTLYKYVPLISETGMHSIADATGLKQIISEVELTDLGNMYSEKFAATHKEFVAHFAEFEPSRVPRMLSRASHIDDMSSPTIDAIAEATQVAAGEFYQVVSDGVQGNYPASNGLMPWVFNRTWPVVSGIMLVDGFGQPAAPYYFLKRTYEQTHIKLDLGRLFWAPNEHFPVSISVINATGKSIASNISVVVMDDTFRTLWKGDRQLTVKPGVAVTKTGIGGFTIPPDYNDRFFFAVVEIKDAGQNLISRSVYWPRSLKAMKDTAYRNKRLNLETPQEWPTFPKGPWLKPDVAKTPTSLAAVLVSERHSDSSTAIKVKVTNTGKVPAFMTQLDVTGAKRIAYADDNYCWLAPGEAKIFSMQVQWREVPAGKNLKLEVFAWNSAKQTLTLNSR
jgi:beta-mannosidase